MDRLNPMPHPEFRIDAHGAYTGHHLSGNFIHFVPQTKLPNATDSASTVYETSKKLLSELWKDHKPLRLMSVALTGVSKDPAAEQLSLFDEPEKQVSREKHERLDKAVSAIRTKFGFDAIQRGTLIGSDYGIARKFKGKSDADRLQDDE